MSGFVIHAKNFASGIWYEPGPYRGPERTRAASVAELRRALADYADGQTTSFAQHWRIITTNGSKVERWKTRPGRAKKTWRKA